MQLETINKLFLELSQITTATTAKELALQQEMDEIDQLIWPNGKPETYEPSRVVRIRAIAKLAQVLSELPIRC